MISVKRADERLDVGGVLEGLDNEQMEAVTSDINSNILCVAVAGSGKTHVLTRRVAYLIANGINPSNIMLTTFTVKASKEMAERVSKILDIKGPNPIMSGTFHSIAVKYLKRYKDAIGFSDGFTILDTDGSTSLISGIRTDYLENHPNLDKKEFVTSRRIFSLHSSMINLNKSIDEMDISPESNIRHIEYIHKEYNRIKGESNYMDFDDLIINFVRLLRIEPIRKEIQKEITHVLGDEYQDVNHLQAEIIELISGKKNTFVVGDPSQSIYAFRGSDVSFINKFQDIYNSEEVILKTNYRSDKNVLELAEKAINKNFQKKPVEINAFKETDFEQSVEEFYNNYEEVESIVDRTKELLAKGVSPNEIAILIRSTGQLVSGLEIAFRRNKIDYELRAGFSYFDRKHIKDLIAMTTLLVNPRGMAELERVLALHKGVGAKTLKNACQFFRDCDYSFKRGTEEIDNSGLSKKAKESILSFFELMVEVENCEIVKEKLRLLTEYYLPIFKAQCKSEEDYEERSGEIREYPGLIEASSIEDFLDDIVLDTSKENDNGDPANKVIISTMHRSKGLEFDYVFIPFMNLGNFPRKMSEPTEVIEEERRLFYVALTRAKKQLFISYSQSVLYKPAVMSPFIDDMLF